MLEEVDVLNKMKLTLLSLRARFRVFVRDLLHFSFIISSLSCLSRLSKLYLIKFPLQSN